ncbi:MAG: FG-GAP repeat domain-containing protein [Planctomycetota bacterium]
MKRTLIFIVLLSMGFPACPVPYWCRAWAEPGPGDVFREYKWRPDGKWQRVTGPDATAEGAKQHLPNSVNTIRIDDLDGAVKVEAYIEMLLCHGGTVDKKIRVNANPWMPIGESPLIPGNAGQGPPNSEYQYMRYPSVRIPIEYLRQGNNTFEFTCSPGTSLGGRWPQWILYGVTFRIYYNSSRPHPAGMITKPSCGSTIGKLPVLEARATGPNPIKQVDFIGFYEDFNWEGDGNYHQWHYRYLYTEIKSHIGTVTKQPYKVIWDNSWVPTQDRPIKIMARIVDAAGMCHMTSAVENIHLVRNRTVRMYKPYDVPKRWSTRVGNTHKCKADIDDDLSKAVTAKIIMATWNGVAADEIGINDKKIVTRVGKNHDLSYDEFEVPLNLIKPGTNTLYTHSTTTHHGIEVQWPGMVLMVTYNEPESENRTADWNFKEIIIDNNPPQPSRITDAEIVDIDYDGRLDLWFSGRGIKDGERKFVWYKNTGDMITWPRFAPFPGSSIGAAWGDVDSDGDMDLITGRERERAALVWMENPLNNSGNPETEIWKVHQIHPDPEDPDEVHTTYIDAQSKVAPGLDLNRDGRLDIVIAAFKKTLWYVPGPKDPKKGPWKFYKLAESSHSHGGARIADIDADGDLDIVWGHDWYENAGEPTAIPWRRHTIDSNWPDECKIAIGDLDKDGFLDVVLTGEESPDGVAWYKNPGADVTETWKKHLVVSGWEGLHSCQLADFDKDGDLDIFTAQMHGRPGQRVAILENKDISTNEWKPHILSTVGSHNAKVADIDGDGDLDIVGKNYDQDKRPRLWVNPN